MSPERSGLQVWHHAPCAWCGKKATGDALHEVGGVGIDWFASCGSHGTHYEDFEA